MKRLAAFLGCLMLTVNTAMATSDFSKTWKDQFIGKDADEAYVSTIRRQSCNICHVKGEDKKKVRNEYGTAINEYLKFKDFPKEYIKENPQEASAKMLEGFKKAGDHKSKDGKTFAEKIKNNEIPATDAKTE